MSTTEPHATPMIRAMRVERPAAACVTVRPGRKRGAWAAAQPATTAATARAAVSRARPNRHRQHSARVARPATAETQTITSAVPRVRSRPESRITNRPARASAPDTSPAARARWRKAVASARSEKRIESAAR